MASSESPSFFKISGTTFDGTTVKSTAWQPNSSPKSQASNYVNQTTIGRLSFADLGQPGSLGQLAIARCDVAAALMTLTVKTLSTAENTAAGAYVAVPAPNNLDATLYTRSLTPDWCLPFLMGPTDAIALTDGLVSGVPATVEIMTVDLQDAASLAYLNALFTTASTTPSVAVRIVTVTEVIPAFSGTQYILGTAAAVSMNLTLPLATAVAEGTTLVVTRINGGWIRILPQDTINGSTSSIVLEDIGQVTFTLRGGVWLASEAPVVVAITVANAVADVAVPLPVSTGTTLVSLNFTARGSLTLPALTDVAEGVEYLLQRTTDNAGFSPSRITITTQAPGDTLNGLANGTAIVSNPGAVVRVLRVTGGWVVVSDRQVTPTQVISNTVSATLDSGWVGSKLVRSSFVDAGAPAVQVLTLPAATLAPVGTRIDVVYVGTGAGALGLNVTSPAADIQGAGQAAGVLTAFLGSFESGSFTWDGTAWQFVRSAPSVRVVVLAADATVTATVSPWNGLREFRCTLAGAQVVTMPAATAAPVGMEAHFVCEGAGGLTINGGGTNIIGAGASAATKAIAQNTAIRIVSNGLNWIQSI